MTKIKIDYNKLMECEIDKILHSIQINDSLKFRKPTLLLHSCCGPCSTACLERLVPVFDITVFFYNPNIDPIEEFDKRIQAQKSFIETCSFTKGQVKLIVPEYQRMDYEKAINLKEFPFRKNEKECLSRCNECYYFRMKKTAEYANDKNFDYWTTTLTLSPYKDAEKVNTIGKVLTDSENYRQTKFLFSDFKKKNGYLRSIELSKEYNLYRQPYCGCIYGRLVQESLSK